MTIFHALKEAKTVEDFICAVADLGDPETGTCENWDEIDMCMTMEAIIASARRYQRPMDQSRGILLKGLVQAEEALKKQDNRASALQAVRYALKNG